jgi:hypothetical protein
VIVELMAFGGTIMKTTVQLSAARFFTAAIRTFLVKIYCATQDGHPIWVLLALDGEPVVDMLITLK